MLISNYKSYIASIEWKIVEIKKSSIFHSISIIACTVTGEYLFFSLFPVGLNNWKRISLKHEYTWLKNSMIHGTTWVKISEKGLSFFHSYNPMIALFTHLSGFCCCSLDVIWNRMSTHHFHMLHQIDHVGCNSLHKIGCLLSHNIDTLYLNIKS